MPGDASSSDPFALVGTLIERKYRVDRVIAEGGFGVVYAGLHRGLDEPIAIKVLKPAQDVDDDAWADLLLAFLEEARTLAKLRHPDIVTVLDAGTMPIDGRLVPWMVLEWLEGETLRDELLRRRAAGATGRGTDECLALLRPVLQAIADAHDAGIAHRDIKPSNVMLVPGVRGVSARVLDFGIAKIMETDGDARVATGDTATASRSRAFTLASAAPEQLSGARTGPWTDVFALGLLLTEVLTDREPIPVGDTNEHYQRVFGPERPTPAALGVDVGAWEPVLARALAVRPSDRQPDARVLLAELVGQHPSQAQQGRPSQVVRPTAGLVDAHARTSPAGTRATTTPTRPPSPLRWGVGVAALLGIGILGSGVVVTAKLLFDAPPDKRAAVAAAAPPDPGACTTSAECVGRAGGRPAVCRRAEGRCVSVDSEDCAAQAQPGDIGRDDTLWIGALFPKTGPLAAEFGVQNHEALELARREVAQIMGEVARPIALVTCDDAADASRAARHLADLGAPAVVGFRGSLEAIELARSVFLPGGVLMISSVNPNPLVTRVPRPDGASAQRLVFRTTASAADATAAAGAFLTEVLEPRLRRERVVPTGALRVAALRPRDAAGDVIGDALLSSLRFNGKSAAENRAEYLEVTFVDDATGQAPELAGAVEALAAFQPHVVVYTGAVAVTRGILAPLEKRLPRARRPTYVSLGEMHDGIYELVGKDADLRGRFHGMTLSGETPENTRLMLRFNDAFSRKTTRTAIPNSTYDAFYLLAYASFSIKPGEPVTGTALAESFARLVPPGRPVSVGTAELFGAFEELRAGRGIDVTGATGPLDFDLQSGEASFDHVILCLGADKTGKASEGVESGLVYSAKTKTLSGTMRCP